MSWPYFTLLTPSLVPSGRYVYMLNPFYVNTMQTNSKLAQVVILMILCLVNAKVEGD